MVSLRKTAADRATSELRAAILAGALSPGERISQDEWAERLEVSRIPVREAIGRLESEGLVSATPYKGAVVAKPSLHELEESYLIRLRLEPLAVRLAVKDMRRQSLDRLESLLTEMETLTTEPSKFFDCNEQFYEALYQAVAESYEQLASIIETVRVRCHYLRRRYMMQPGQVAQVLETRRRQMSAIREENAVLAEEISQAALEKSWKSLAKDDA